MDYLTTHTSLSPIRRGFTSVFVHYKKKCTRLAAASDKVYQLLAHGWWVSPGTLASSTTKTGRHDIAKILLKVSLKHKKSNQIIINKPLQIRMYTELQKYLEIYTVTGKQKWTLISLEHTDLLFLAFII